MDIPPPFNDVKWGIAGGKNALSWPHIDGNGFGTVVAVTTGSKYWILMRERRDFNLVFKSDTWDLHLHLPNTGIQQNFSLVCMNMKAFICLQVPYC